VETEIVTIFDENMQRLGTKMRKDVHAQGYWHETFHCWFTRQDAGKTYLLFQLRALQKKDFPGLLDITAAGHLLAGEQIADGIREITEELGIALLYNDLQPVGIIKEQILLNDFLDKEFCHVYLYKYNGAIDSFILQAREVAGMLQIEINDFARLVDGETKTVRGMGYNVETDGSKTHIDRNYSLSDICPHSKHYFLKLIHAVQPT
jgi:isopentenyldiphosphate isomerase